MTPEEIWWQRVEQRNSLVAKARQAIQSREGKAPSAAGRMVNAVYRAQTKIIAAHLAVTAEKLSGEEREHLRYAAEFLGFKYDGEDSR
jgi:hypothetical protein